MPFIRYLTFANTELLLVNNLQANREVLQAKCYEFEKPEFFRGVVGELVGVGLLPRGKSTKCGGSLHHRQPFGHLPMYIVRL